ncbi:ABC transporter permease [Phyllobacterium myrsinacearum]|jgi:putative spermidine/putrescine transport system permease protein|uniref:ABC transporter permease n=1 Tax=Phyllobacterium myrsinacearum TaxID=28101 RepID=A0A2S9JGS5_9HYPH|nr:ABC transporter permease [Phyllobacterium myrsinacearum]PRD52192.1 ABC transporter permease [Phyllobacterium myrsinacearum]PWV83759.1 putative spermidine/putrescine transport system permease protein [Phyllobacterium myrsinacearum]RZV04718.1 putative spermidine/putrescine transport system permease protein [Phyllobacterium myrsinacearum]
MTAVEVDRINVFMAVRRAQRPARRAALSLALPLIVFLAIAFVAPILYLLVTAVGNPETREVLPQTLRALESWDGISTLDEPVYAAFANDLKVAKDKSTAALLGKRLNYEISGMRSRVLAAARMVEKLDTGPYKEKFLELNKDWDSRETWEIIKRNGASFTPYYMLTALDLQQANGSIKRVQGDQAIFLDVLARTLFVAGLVTLFTLILGYPVAYVLTIAPKAIAGFMMLMVLLPLWTSLLVRTTAWVVLLQSDGIINDVLTALHLTSERLQLIFTRTGTVIAMTHIQLPFTILPIYSVMRSIPATQLRAARSLGAPPSSAFWRIYAPQTLPGVVAGCLMTFILSLGYYITPALVGGPRDQMVSNFISVYINRDLNWGLAAALGVVLLVVTLAIYLLFLRLVGADKIKLG